MLALYGFDLVHTAWIEPTPATIRHADLLIERLMHEPGKSLWASAQRKAREVEAKSFTNEELEASRQANRHEHFGWDENRWALYALESEISSLRFIVTTALAGKDADVQHTPPRRPGMPITGTTSEVEEIDIDDFDPNMLGL